MKFPKDHKVQIIRPKESKMPMHSKKVDRNSLCHCGSGKKTKKCCGTQTKYYCL